MKMLRIFGIASAVLAALLTAMIAVLYVVFDEKAIKDELTRQVEVKTGRTLMIDGELALSVWPNVGLRIGRVTLSEAGDKSQFAALDSARVAVAVMPLLNKRLEARHIEIEGLALTLIKRKDGSLNISDLLTSPDKPEESVTAKPAGGEAANAPLRIDIAGVALRNSRLTWRDQAAGEVVELADLDFTSGRLFGDVAKRSFELEKLTLATQGKTGNELFELSLDLPSLKISAESLLGKSLNLLARLQGEKRQLEGRGALAGINGSLKNLLVEQVSLNLAARQGDLALTANLTSPLSYEASGRRLVLEKILGGLDVASPALPMKQVKLLLTGQLAADLAKQAATLSINTKLDDSNIALKLAVNPFSPLILGFGLDIDRLRAASSGRDNTNGGENRPESGQQRCGRGED
ncbi:MAG: AsmA family protein [Azonexus sp.]|nr:AsmA family protein [Azonexus sp.]MDZ4316852.1 AsmA family protein [Azonexus sp.]